MLFGLFVAGVDGSDDRLTLLQEQEATTIQQLHNVKAGIHGAPVVTLSVVASGGGRRAVVLADKKNHQYQCCMTLGHPVYILLCCHTGRLVTLGAA